MKPFFGCKECPFGGTESNVRNHVLAKHREHETSPFLCAVCHFTAHQRSDLMLHSTTKTHLKKVKERDDHSAKVLIYNRNWEILEGREYYRYVNDECVLNVIEEVTIHASGRDALAKELGLSISSASTPTMHSSPQSDIEVSWNLMEINLDQSIIKEQEEVGQEIPSIIDSVPISNWEIMRMEKVPNVKEEQKQPSSHDKKEEKKEEKLSVVVAPERKSLGSEKKVKEGKKRSVGVISEKKSHNYERKDKTDRSKEDVQKEVNKTEEAKVKGDRDMGKHKADYKIPKRDRTEGERKIKIERKPVKERLSDKENGMKSGSPLKRDEPKDSRKVLEDAQHAPFMNKNRKVVKRSAVEREHETSKKMKQEQIIEVTVESELLKELVSTQKRLVEVQEMQLKMLSKLTHSQEMLVRMCERQATPNTVRRGSSAARRPYRPYYNGRY